MCLFEASIVWPPIHVFKSLLHTCFKTQKSWELIECMESSQRAKTAVILLDKNVIHVLMETILCHHRKIIFFLCSILYDICCTVEKTIFLLSFYNAAMAWMIMVTCSFEGIFGSKSRMDNQPLLAFS